VADYLANIFAQWESQVSAAELRDGCAVRTLAAIVRYVYEKEARTRGKRRVFVKENHAYRFIPFTLANFPESRFVWMVRDPRDMALCQRDSILSGGVQTAVKAWKTDQEAGLKVYGYLYDAGKILLVKFEELLSEPENTCRRICEFLRLPFDPAMLEFHKNENVARNAGTNTAWSDLARPIIADNFSNYRTGLSEAEIRYVEAYCREEMTSLGYTLDYPVDADLETLAAALPDEAQFRVPRNEKELARYEPYGEMLGRLRERWRDRPVTLARSHSEDT